MPCCRATSADGRTLTVEPGGPWLPAPGEVVRVDGPGPEVVLAQVLSAGEGVVLGVLAGTELRRGPVAPFADAALAPVEDEHLDAVLRAGSATLEVGTWSRGAPARLRAGGFNRHTFLCGQSGSGKTYALGVVLERLMLGTELRTVVLDPNADFVRLGECRDDVPTEVATALLRRGVHVLGAGRRRAEPLRMRFATLPPRAQAAVLRLDPIADRAEYAVFREITRRDVLPDLVSLLERMRAGAPGEVALSQRVANLGLADWQVWAQDQASAAEVVTGRGGVTVLDLSGFGDPQEPVAVCLDVVETLWARREERVPTLIVIDEAHNLCPPAPDGPLATALVDRLVQIAAEGRKYGLWLLLSTQRPSKVHPQVVSQCDNLMLMRMNSPLDVAELSGWFGFAPPAMMAAARAFVQGEALFVGAFAAVPMVVRMADRWTHEGGRDIQVPLVHGGS